MNGLMLFVSLMTFATDDDEIGAKFAKVRLEEPFDECLLANPLLMEVTGAKVIRRAVDEFMVVGVASTALKDGSAKERLRAEKVCRIKALAAIVGEKRGVQVAHVEQLKEKTVVVVEDGKETAKSIAEYLEITRTKVEGVAKDMPVVGTWESVAGDVYYLAIGMVCDNRGNPVAAKDNSENPD
jgi:hypothetical protein